MVCSVKNFSFSRKSRLSREKASGENVVFKRIDCVVEKSLSESINKVLSAV